MYLFSLGEEGEKSVSKSLVYLSYVAHFLQDCFLFFFKHPLPSTSPLTDWMDHFFVLMMQLIFRSKRKSHSSQPPISCHNISTLDFSQRQTSLLLPLFLWRTMWLCFLQLPLLLFVKHMQSYLKDHIGSIIVINLLALWTLAGFKIVIKKYKKIAWLEFSNLKAYS